MPGFSPVAKGSDVREILSDVRSLLARLGDPTEETLATIVAKLGDPSTALGALLENGTYGLSALNTDLDALLTRLSAARAGYLDNINNPQLLNLPNVSLMEHEIEFPSAEALNDIALTGERTTSECTITVALPSGATIRRVLLLALVTAMNNTANAQKIDVTVRGRKGAGGWSNFFSQDDLIGFGAVDGATTSLVAVQDVTALVDEAATYGFRLSVNQSAAQSVRYTTQFLLVVTYRMS